jgi:hypothetical protein
MLYKSTMLVAVRVVTNGHDITPKPGSVRSARSGEPADLKNPLHYPIEAVCIVCGQPVRNERYYLAEWRHIENPGP